MNDLLSPSSRPSTKRPRRPNGFVRALTIVVERGLGLEREALLASPRRASSRPRGPHCSPPEELAPKPRTASAAPRLKDCRLKNCPRCGHSGEIERDFGFRRIQGVLRPQSWCRRCRTGAAPEPSRVLERVARVSERLEALEALPLFEKLPLNAYSPASSL